MNQPQRQAAGYIALYIPESDFMKNEPAFASVKTSQGGGWFLIFKNPTRREGDGKGEKKKEKKALVVKTFKKY